MAPRTPISHAVPAALRSAGDPFIAVQRPLFSPRSIGFVRLFVCKRSRRKKQKRAELARLVLPTLAFLGWKRRGSVLIDKDPGLSLHAEWRASTPGASWSRPKFYPVIVARDRRRKRLNHHIVTDNNPQPPPPVDPIPLRADACALTRLDTPPPAAATAAGPSPEPWQASAPCPLSRTQVRHATFIPRPRRPYTFTQLVTLSDGSAYTMRTTSPQPIYRASKDTRNTLLWQPSEKSLKNVELDEAGKLAAFRERYGRAYDSGTAAEEEGGAEDDVGYADLITGYAPAQDAGSLKDSGPKKQAKKRK
ncbi:hypothetical protein AUP68_08964 [Ilyonectria robusta]